MRVTPAALMAELVLSADRMVRSAGSAPVVPGQWPPQVALGHLAVNDRQTWAPRIALMVNANRAGSTPPDFAWVEPDAAATEAHYGGLSLDEAASDLMAARIALVTQVRELGPGDWEATARHEVFGEMDVAELLLRLLAHDEEHRAGMLQVDLGGTL